MPDNSQYPYTRLLTFIKDGCKQIGEERDFVTYLLSMGNAVSVESMIEIYNNIFKLLVNIHYKDNAPEKWYTYGMWANDEQALLDELNSCLNDSILSWYKKQEQPTDEQIECCFANLRESENYNTAQAEILKTLPKGSDKKYSKLLHEVKELYTRRKQIDGSTRNKADNLYMYKEYSKYIVGHGRVLDIAETKFCDFHGIDHEKLAQEYKEEAEQWRKLKEKKKEEERVKKRKSIIGIVLAIIILVPLLYIAIKIDLLAIIILIGLPGALPSIIKKGKV